MTERTATEAGAIACPFVAFVDDRDARADAPDHRHRCYAEVRPAPRAIAHQQAFCLSAGFAACPTFQDWARREAARTRGSTPVPRTGDRDPRPTDDEDRGPADSRLTPMIGAPLDDGWPSDEPPASDLFEPVDGPDDQPEDDQGGHDAAGGDEDEPFDPQGGRNPHRDWAAPPPWVEPPAGLPGDPGAPPFLSGRGPEADPAVAAAGLSASRWLQEVPAPRDGDPAPGRDPDDELERALAEDRANRERAAALAGAAAATAASRRAAARRMPKGSEPPAVSTSRAHQATRMSAGPAWERPRRFEAYPTLKTRIGLPAMPRIAVAGLALLAAAVIAFSLPFLVKLAGGQGGSVAPTPTPSALASASIAPSDTPVPTSKIYVIKSGDTLLKIAKRNGLTIDQLLAANKQIKDPNKIAVGDQIVIPLAAPSEVINGASPGASASP
jgi:nucleoid-associated protein YgaU